MMGPYSPGFLGFFPGFPDRNIIFRNIEVFFVIALLPYGVKVVLSLAAAALISFLATPIVKRMAYAVGAIDVPKDDRRMHSEPIPRLGGLAIAIAFLLTVVVLADLNEQIRGILFGAVIILVLGVVDDCVALRAVFKFLIQILAAYIVVRNGCSIRYLSNPFSDVGYMDLGIWSVPITIIWIVAITNAVNFIDGLDGLACGVSAISAATLLVISLLIAEGNVAVIVAALVGGCLGFLPYNFNPAKIFMGDTGSTFLGFILACLSIQGMFKLYAIISFAVPFLVLSIPIFDICFAILRRLAKGQNPMKADRGHIHHRLIDMGFSQKQTVAITYLLTAMLGLAAVVLTTSGEVKALILLGTVIVVGAIGFRVIFRRAPSEAAEEKDTANTK